jgi:hypothetical protein
MPEFGKRQHCNGIQSDNANHPDDKFWMFFQFHQAGQLLKRNHQQDGEQDCGKQKACKTGIVYFFFILNQVEPEIGCFHSVGENDVQECSRGKKNGDVAKLVWAENIGEDWGQQVIDEPSKDIAEAVPDGLFRELSDSSQGFEVSTKVSVL